MWYKIRVTLFLASFYNWLVLARVLAAMVWLGALVILAAFADRILRRGEAEEAGRVVGSLRVIGPLALAPSPLTLLAAGLAMVGDSDAGPRSSPSASPRTATTARRSLSCGGGRGARR